MYVYVRERFTAYFIVLYTVTDASDLLLHTFLHEPHAHTQKIAYIQLFKNGQNRITLIAF